MDGLTADDLLQVAIRVVGPDVAVADHGLLAAAVARVWATVDGEDVYPTPAEKAAALLHSLALNGPLVTGNRRFALAAALVLMGLHDQPAAIAPDDAVELVTGVMTGKVETVAEIARALEGRRGAR
ncbi:type II toxin-antitoxin system death-on-curing family toxin [Klenkia sp. PcliD-1-E]|uniref:type II toxin-antitoxin system death-on-curing family toxin n=1 Tax=Klenkia sp. PcliD-1-E TaxID=2954492 RepID=UPI002096AC7F|nr:type II toxin-antitoxin system death-on-curing family toxin [Klenkia sp. PcliD-1-E]MCO7221093.1 type II toxin-antitoxin system death-on-curing family toxin [Klenkia sp. PcliD-1-E]